MRVAIALLLLCVFLCFSQEPSTSGKPPRKVTLADLAFISGDSQGEIEGGWAEEHWSDPIADSMMGVYRYVKNGKVQMYELLVIEQTGDGPVLRLKHFHPGLVGWEEKAQVWSYPLIHWTKNEAVFERPDKGTRITYRADEHGALESTLERTGKNKEVFKYRHSPK